MNNDIVQKLAEEWRVAGLVEGDTVLIHSTIGRTLRRTSKMGVKTSPQQILESFLEAIGKSGTLLLPLFNFDFTKGSTFDIRNTPSHMGVLTEAARLWPNAVRTGHPLYSFSVIGKNAPLFRGVKNFSGYGNDSPFAILHNLDGKIGVIDLPDQKSMTFYHYVEEQSNAPYRYHKTFTSPYIDENGVESTKTFGLFVRKIEEGVTTHVDPMGELLWEKGLYTGFRPKEGCGLRLISAKKMFDEVTTVLKNGKSKGLLYIIQ